jgi:hypothetical protein
VLFNQQPRSAVDFEEWSGMILVLPMSGMGEEVAAFLG